MQARAKPARRPGAPARLGESLFDRDADEFDRAVSDEDPVDTLANQLLDTLGHGTLRSLDEAGVLEAAVADPIGFVAAGARPLVVGEVQRAGAA